MQMCPHKNAFFFLSLLLKKFFGDQQRRLLNGSGSVTADVLLSQLLSPRFPSPAHSNTLENNEALPSVAADPSSEAW